MKSSLNEIPFNEIGDPRTIKFLTESKTLQDFVFSNFTLEIIKSNKEEEDIGILFYFKILVISISTEFFFLFSFYFQKIV